MADCRHCGAGGRGERWLILLVALATLLLVVQCVPGDSGREATQAPGEQRTAGLPATMTLTTAPPVTMSPTTAPPATIAPTAVPTAILPATAVPSTPSAAETPGTPASQSHFGINYVYHGLQQFIKRTGGTAQDYLTQQNTKLSDLGISWVRSGGPGDPTSLNWAAIEPQAGVFDFTLHDLRVQDAGVHGLLLLGNVDWSVIPAYAQVAGKYFDDTQYLVYLNHIVERYDGDGVDDMPGLTQPIRFWEIGNEVDVQAKFRGTPQDYAHVLQISYQAIKATCADCQVLISGLAIGKANEAKWEQALGYFSQVLAAGGGAYFDVMNYHEYNQGDDFMTYVHVDGFRQALARYNLDKPIWITEGNTPLTAKGTPIATLEQQAQDIIKRYVISFDAGVQVYMWHMLDDVRGGPGAGLFDENGAPKPDYYNLKLLIAQIGGYSSEEKIDLGNTDLNLFRFDLPDRWVFLLWTEGQDTTLDLSSSLQQASVDVITAITVQGQAEPQVTTVQSSSVPATETPVFIVINK